MLCENCATNESLQSCTFSFDLKQSKKKNFSTTFKLFTFMFFATQHPCPKGASQCGRPARLNNLSSYSPG